MLQFTTYIMGAIGCMDNGGWTDLTRSCGNIIGASKSTKIYTTKILSCTLLIDTSSTTTGIPYNNGQKDTGRAETNAFNADVPQISGLKHSVIPSVCYWFP